MHKKNSGENQQFTTRIAPAKHSQRRDGHFIFPSSGLIFRNRRKGSFVDRKLCGRLTETYNYVFHYRNLFLPPPGPIAVLKRNTSTWTENS